MNGYRLLTVGLGGLLLGLAPPGSAGADRVTTPAPVDYSRAVRPILSEHCYACHGPDAARRKARLRLDTREGAFGPLRSGGTPVVPGSRSLSTLYERLTTEDDHARMPPRRSGKRLSAAEIERIGRWIDQGARWEEH
jgi:mono/diheme cytochrome c family protein